MMFETNIEKYNIKYHLSNDVIGVITTVEDWFTEYICISIKEIFSPKIYILKNIKKHSTLEDIFKKLDDTEISEIKKRIEDIAIESCERYLHKKDTENIEDLRIKKVNKLNKNITPVPETKIKRCSKCGVGLFIGLYVERKKLFSSKKKRWCFSCYNKLKSRAGKLEPIDLSTKKLELIDLSTGKNVNKNIILQTYLDKKTILPKEMKEECFNCGYNIGFKNIPSEVCLECSVYDITKTDNKFKKENKKRIDAD